MKQKLDPKALWFFFAVFILRWSIFIIIVSFYGAQMTFFDLEKIGSALLGFLWWLLIITPVFFVIGFIYAKLTYHFYRYEMTDDGFQKERGIIWKRYVTIPYDRIQNVDIYRGVIARTLGLSDLHIQTAGSSASGMVSSAEGALPGLSREIAEQIRDELVRRAKNTKNQGL